MVSADPERILVVDDNRVNRLLLEKRLQQGGYDVLVASGGQEALTILGLEGATDESGGGAEALDAVVLDVMMPEIDGLEVLRRIREVQSTNELPVIMATAKDQSEDIVEALQLGANDYVVKPIDVPVLLARLRTQVSLRRTHLALKKAQKSLIEAAKMESVGYLAAGVAHEVRNPLAQIQMGIEVLGDSDAVKADPNGAAVVKIMTDAVEKADSIIQELMKVSTSGQLDLKPGSVNELINEISEAVKPAATKGGVKVELDLAKKLSPVPLASTELRSVFSIVIMNAIEAMPDGGTLAVRTGEEQVKGIARDEGSRSGIHLREGEECVLIELTDTGTGIEKEKIHAVFDPFFTSKATGQGTGLGLSVAKKVVELHHGTISVGNRTDRSGVRVSIQLPKASSLRTSV